MAEVADSGSDWAGDGPMPLEVMAATVTYGEPEPEAELPPVVSQSSSAPQLGVGVVLPEVTSIGSVPPLGGTHRLTNSPQSMELLLELESGSQDPAVVYTDLLRDYSRFLTELGEVASDGAASEGTLRALDMLDESAHDLLLELDAGVEAITAAAAAKKMHERRNELTQQQALLQALQSSAAKMLGPDDPSLVRRVHSTRSGSYSSQQPGESVLGWPAGVPPAAAVPVLAVAEALHKQGGTATAQRPLVEAGARVRRAPVHAGSSSFNRVADEPPESIDASHIETVVSSSQHLPPSVSATTKVAALTAAPSDPTRRASADRSRLRADRQQKRSARSLAMASQAGSSKSLRGHGSNSNSTRSLSSKARDNLNSRTVRTLGSIPSDRRAGVNPKMLTKKMVMQELLLQMHKKWRTMNYVPQRPRKDVQIGGEFGMSSGMAGHTVDIPLTAHSSGSGDLEGGSVGKFEPASGRSSSSFMEPTGRRRPKASTVRRAAELIESKAVKYEHVMGRMKVAYSQGGKGGSARSRRGQPMQGNYARSRRATRIQSRSSGGGGSPQRNAGATGSRVVPLSPYKISNPSDPLGILSRSGGGMRAGPIASYAAPISRNGKSRESARKMPLNATRKLNGNKTMPVTIGAAALRSGGAEASLDDSSDSADSLPLDLGTGSKRIGAASNSPAKRATIDSEDAVVATELARTAMEDQRRQLAQLFDDVDAAEDRAALPVDVASAAHSTNMLEQDVERLKQSVAAASAPPSPYKNSQAIRNPRDPLGILSRSGGGMRTPIAGYAAPIPSRQSRGKLRSSTMR